MVLEKPAKDITQGDLELLVDREELEGQRLDYKEAFPGKREDRSELVRHIVGMANTTGGYVLIGVEEERDGNGNPTGKPMRICGLQNTNVDRECLQLENMLRDSVKPRIVPQPEIEHVTTDYGPAVVVRTRRSLTKPHMFRHRFYARQGRQTNPLEVEQVRVEFLEGEALPQRIRDFRADRLADVIGGERANILAQPANMVVHVCPLEAFSTLSGRRVVNVAAVYAKNIAPPGYPGGGIFARLNFDGACSFAGEPGESGSYFQVFRNGCVEFATTAMLGKAKEGETIFRIREAAKLLVDQLPTTLRALDSDVITYPLMIAVSFLGVKGARAFFPAGHDWTKEVQEERAILPEVMLEEESDDWGSALRDLLDTVWQGVGRRKCDLFDDEGRFVSPG